MFALTETAINAAELRARLQAPEVGALVVFEGWVRNHHRGRPVTRLDYEAFAEMAQSEGDLMLAEIEAEFPGVRLVCVHRCGELVPGDIAVWIGASSAHRDEAFRAARLAIEEVKRRLPVWKKEFHPGAEPVWVNCTEDTGVKTDPAAYNARQAALAEVGAVGQGRLAAACVLVVGVGGLGCPAALYLGGAGVGRLTLVDGGKVEYSNLHRQVLFEAGDVGAPKATRAALALRARNPHLVVEAVNADLTAANVSALIAGSSVVLDCTDNFTTRLLLHDACLAAGVTLVQAAVHQWEGVLNVFQRGAGGCLYCTGLPREASELDRVGACAGAPIFGPTVGTLGIMQAAEAIKVLLGRGDDDVATHHTLLVDLLSISVTRIARPARTDCPYCASRVFPVAASEASEAKSLWVSASERGQLGSHRLVALVTTEEKAERVWREDDFCISPEDTAGVERVVRDAVGAVVLACPNGVRSAAFARSLRAAGFSEVYALEGGL